MSFYVILMKGGMRDQDITPTSSPAQPIIKLKGGIQAVGLGLVYNKL